MGNCIFACGLSDDIEEFANSSSKKLSHETKHDTYTNDNPLATEDNPTAGMYVIEDLTERARKLEDFYEIEDPSQRELGRGHYGEVRVMKHRATGQAFAVKTVIKKKPIYVQMLRQEAEILKDLRGSRYIITLHEIFETERNTRQALRGVKVLHDRSIAHRDLKPDNMLMTSKNPNMADIKLIDFGLATYVAPGELLRRHVGTPYYIAPEVLRKKYSKECDMWSMGVILFTMLCGYPPFWGDTERDVYMRIQRGYYMFDGPDWVSRSNLARDMINRLLNQNPKKRLDVDAALAHPWILNEGQDELQAFDRRVLSMVVLKPNTGCLILIASTPQAFCRLSETKTTRACTHGERYKYHLQSSCPVCNMKPGRRVGSPLLNIFETFDIDNSGEISVEDLYRAFRDRGAGIPMVEIEHLFRQLNVASDGSLSFVEFAAALMPRLLYFDENHLFDLFNELDKNDDGLLCPDDMKQVVGNNLSYAESLIAECDLNRDGFVDFHEFLVTMSGSEAHRL